jgi:hypothetical protein
MIFSLAQDFHDAVAAMPVEHPKHRMLGLLAEAIRRDIYFIDRHPTTLFQCMWNSCWWYDCPEAAEYYKVSDGDKSTPPWEQECIKLSAILGQWREAKGYIMPGFIWVRSLYPYTCRLGAPRSTVLQPGHGADATGLLVIENYLISAGGDGTVRLWDATSLLSLASVKGHNDAVTFLLSESAKCFISAAKDGRVLRWHIERFGTPEDVTSVVELPEHLRDKAKPNCSFADPSVDPLTLPNGGRVFAECCGKTDKGVSKMRLIMQSRATAQQMTLHEEDGDVRALILMGGRVVAAWSNCVYVWNATSGQLEHIFRHPDIVDVLVALPNGRIATGCWEGYVRVWALNSNEAPLIDSDRQKEFWRTASSIRFGTWDTESRKLVNPHSRTWNISVKPCRDGDVAVEEHQHCIAHFPTGGGFFQPGDFGAAWDGCLYVKERWGVLHVMQLTEG